MKLLKLYYLRVKKLWLRFCQLKDKGVNYLLDILDETSGKTQLNSLYLDCNGITCEGAKKIAQVHRNKLIIHRCYHLSDKLLFITIIICILIIFIIYLL